MPWGAQVRTDVVRDRELLELMRASGADFVALGLESVNQATLDGYEKSQTVDDIEQAIKHPARVRRPQPRHVRARRRQRHRRTSVRDTVDFALKNHIDTVMLNILTPLPGTQQFEDLDAPGRIITKDWYLYDAQHVVFQPQADERRASCSARCIRGNRRFFYAWRPVSGVRDRGPPARRKLSLQPHARVRLVLVVRAHVGQRRAQPRPHAAARASSGRRPPGRAPARRRAAGVACRLRAGRRPAGASRACPRRVRRESPACKARRQAARSSHRTGDTMATATFAAGCFWGVEAALCGARPASLSTEVGYTGGTTPDPTYEQVCSHRTGHAEAVRVEYDPERDLLRAAPHGLLRHARSHAAGPPGSGRGRPVSLGDLLPHARAGGGGARRDPRASRRSGRYRRPVVTQVAAAPEWWRAEDYHQKYFEKHGRASCAI